MDGSQFGCVLRSGVRRSAVDLLNVTETGDLLGQGLEGWNSPAPGRQVRQFRFDTPSIACFVVSIRLSVLSKRVVECSCCRVHIDAVQLEMDNNTN